MNSIERRNLAAAQSLHEEVMNEGLEYGCFEIALTALGGRFDLSEVRREGREAMSVFEKIEKAGLKVNWIVNTEAEITADDVHLLFSGKLPFEESYPEGKLTGYLWIETYPDQPGHALTIYPSKCNNYTVMDTRLYSFIRVTAENLAHMANYVVSQGGSFQIAQIKKPL